MNNFIFSIFFGVGTMIIGFISRKSLFHPSSHGFYRFFAWELLLVMILLNIPGWFYDPFAPHQLISWVLLCVSLFLVVHGFLLLRKIGKPDTAREGAPLLALEKTSHLVTTGAYRYIRHPLYSSLFFLGWGIFMKSPSWADAVLLVLCTFFLTATAVVEEMENIAYFGEEYKKYMKQTKMFVPFIF